MKYDVFNVALDTTRVYCFSVSVNLRLARRLAALMNLFNNRALLTLVYGWPTNLLLTIMTRCK